MVNKQTLLSCTALLGLAAAQQNFYHTATDDDIETIENQFTTANFTPSLFTPFYPQGWLNFRYAQVFDSPGESLSRSNTSIYPDLSIAPADNATAFNTSALFTAVLVSLGPDGDDVHANQTVQWLTNDVYMQTVDVNNPPYFLNYSGDATVDYVGPNPPLNTSSRYVLAVISQPSSFSPPYGYTGNNQPVSAFDLEAYIEDSGLGSVLAATWFEVFNDGSPIVYPINTTTSSTSMTSTSSSSVSSTLAASTTAMSTTAAAATSSKAAALGNLEVLSKATLLTIGLSSLGVFLGTWMV